MSSPTKEVRNGAAGETGSTPVLTGYFDEDLIVRGAFATDVSTLGAISMELLLGAGKTKDNQEFLTPYFDVELDGNFLAKIKMDEDQATEKDEPSSSISVTLTFDNVAFALERVAKRYQRLVKTLIEISQSGIMPVPGRVAYSADALRRASVALAATADEFQASLSRFDEKRAAGEADD